MNRAIMTFTGFIVLIIVAWLSSINTQPETQFSQFVSSNIFRLEKDEANELPQNQDSQDIKIGLMIPDTSTSDLLSLSARRGAALAVKQANESGGYQGTPFRLIVRSANGHWGTGSNEMVKMIYEDEVCAVVSALDGRNSHLTEQVAAKSHIVQLETRASDETLSQAFVPWFFRVVPNDKQQSESLIREMQDNQYNTTFILFNDTYDDKMAARSFRSLAEKKGLQIAGMGTIDEILKNGRMMDDTIEAVVFYGFFEVEIFDRLKDIFKDAHIFGPLSATADGMIGKHYSSGSEGGLFISSNFCFTTSGQQFKKAFLNEYNEIPNPAASYAFVGVSLIIESVRAAGTERQAIRDFLSENRFEGGVTGTVEFDEMGNRISPAFMIQIIKGHPVILNP